MLRSRAPRTVLAASVASIVLAAAWGSTGCGRRATREWGPDDHDLENPSSTQQQAASPAGSGPSAADETRALVETAWSANCVTCHGRAGQGDGPQGPMVKAPNLTDPALLDKRTDAELAAVIRGGRNKMPSFASLPDRVVTGLVARIRSGRAGE